MDESRADRNAKDVVIPDCDFGWRLSRHWIFVSGGLVSTCIALFALSLLMVFIEKLSKSKSQGNFKFVLIGYFGLHVLATIFRILSTSYDLFNTLLAKTACDVLMEGEVSKLATMISMSLLTAPIICVLILPYDRYRAINNTEAYKNMSFFTTRVMSGLFFFNAMIWFIMDEDRSYRTGSISFNLLPLGMYNVAFFNLCATLIFIGCYLRYTTYVESLYSDFIEEECYARDIEHHQEVIFDTEFIILLVRYCLRSYGCFIILTLLIQSHGDLIFSDKIYHEAFLTTITNILIPTISCLVVQKADNQFDYFETRKPVGVLRVREILYAMRRLEKIQTAKIERALRKFYDSKE